MILHTQSLYDTLHDKCNKAKKRIWVASPFIGYSEHVSLIIGDKWKEANLDCRILTDIQAGFIKHDAFKAFIEHNVPVKSLFSLHAKIYIVDDWCLITSANLTRTAFERRFETGIVCDKEDAMSAINLYIDWWESATLVSDADFVSERVHSTEEYELDKHLWFRRQTRITNAYDENTLESVALDKCIKWYIDHWAEHHPVIGSMEANDHVGETYKWVAFEKAQRDFCKDEFIIETIQNKNSSLASCWNLLQGPKYFPRRMLKKLVSVYPNEVKQKMCELLDERIPLGTRIETFKHSMDEMATRAKRLHPEMFNASDPGSMQGLRAMAVYLSMRHPDRHYLYKAEEYDKFLAITGLLNEKMPFRIKDKYEIYERFCDRLCTRISECTELVEKCEKTYGQHCYNLHLMTQDLMFLVANKMKVDKE